MGSTTEYEAVSYPYEGFEYGSLSMAMVLFGEAAEPPSQPRVAP